MYFYRSDSKISLSVDSSCIQSNKNLKLSLVFRRMVHCENRNTILKNNLANCLYCGQFDDFYTLCQRSQHKIFLNNEIKAKATGFSY